MARCERSAGPHGDVARRQTRPSKRYSTVLTPDATHAKVNPATRNRSTNASNH
ncbi:hypothetical protein XOCgx_0571 [Xanthomonas oryzae pv. oryzicola]|nr:hypothetical protein XOCgx_0571 [Xanthomonas oryzae pv. oryzicola]